MLSKLQRLCVVTAKQRTRGTRCDGAPRELQRARCASQNDHTRACKALVRAPARPDRALARARPVRLDALDARRAAAPAAARHARGAARAARSAGEARARRQAPARARAQDRRPVRRHRAVEDCASRALLGRGLCAWADWLACMQYKSVRTSHRSEPFIRNQPSCLIDVRLPLSLCVLPSGLDRLVYPCLRRHSSFPPRRTRTSRPRSARATPTPRPTSSAAPSTSSPSVSNCPFSRTQ